MAEVKQGAFKVDIIPGKFSVMSQFRTRERITLLGEVFTPDQYIESMLSQITRSRRRMWGDVNQVFFEPSCGHGNFVVSILRRRLDALYDKATKFKFGDPILFSISNSMNTIWAIDIDIDNINICRERVLNLFLEFISEKSGIPQFDFLKRNRDFFSHLLCAICWHIEDNEALSALMDDKSPAHENGCKTKNGRKWLQDNGHFPINFDLTWVQFYRDCETKSLVPIEFERAQQFVSNALNGSKRGMSNFSFASTIVNKGTFNRVSKGKRLWRK